jgi:hypothetical protein
VVTLDQFFAEPSASPDIHPRVRSWKSRLTRPGVSATLEVSPHERDFGSPPREMHVQFIEGETLLPLESVAWSDELNDGLINLGVRGADTEEEAIRFALGLRAAFRIAERAFGDGYFSSVLVDYVKNSDLRTWPEMEKVLPYIGTNAPHREANTHDAYSTCRQHIETRSKDGRPN